MGDPVQYRRFSSLAGPAIESFAGVDRACRLWTEPRPLCAGPARGAAGRTVRGLCELAALWHAAILADHRIWQSDADTGSVYSRCDPTFQYHLLPSSRFLFCSLDINVSGAAGGLRNGAAVFSSRTHAQMDDSRCLVHRTFPALYGLSARRRCLVVPSVSSACVSVTHFARHRRPLDMVGLFCAQHQELATPVEGRCRDRNNATVRGMDGNSHPTSVTP